MQFEISQDIYERMMDYCQQYSIECNAFLESLLDGILPRPCYAIKEGDNWFTGNGFSENPKKAMMMNKDDAFGQAKKLKGVVVKVYKGEN